MVHLLKKNHGNREQERQYGIAAISYEAYIKIKTEKATAIKEKKNGQTDKQNKVISRMTCCLVRGVQGTIRWYVRNFLHN